MSRGLLGKIARRHGYPVEIAGDTFYLRPMSQQTLRRRDEVRELPVSGTDEEKEIQRTKNADASVGLVYGICICVDRSGEPEFQQNAGESDFDFGVRVRLEMEDFEFPVLRAISEAITKISITNDAEAVLKNSQPTAPHDSPPVSPVLPA